MLHGFPWLSRTIRLYRPSLAAVLPGYILYLYRVANRFSAKALPKTHLKSPWNLSVSPLITWNIRRRVETSSVKLADGERKSLKQEGTQQLSYAGNLEKALPHQPLPPPFLVLNAQDSSVHWLVSLTMCTLTDPVLNPKVDQRVVINNDEQRRKKDRFSLVVQPMLVHVKGSTGVYRLWVLPYFSTSVPHVWFV